MRAMTASGTVPSTIAGRIEMAQRVEKSAGLIGQERVDRHEPGRLVERIVDEVDAARDWQ